MIKYFLITYSCYWSQRCGPNEYEDISLSLKHCCLKGDINKDGRVDIKDLIIVAKSIGEPKTRLGDKWLETVDGHNIGVEHLKLIINMFTPPIGIESCKDGTKIGTCNAQGFYCGRKNLLINGGFEIGRLVIEE